MSNMSKKKKVLLSSIAVLLCGAMVVPFCMTIADGVKTNRSLDYIESLKTSYQDGNFRILELAPSESDGVFGYYVAGSEPIAEWETDASMFLTKAERKAYVDGLFSTLRTKNIISQNGATPLNSYNPKTNDAVAPSYSESYPWELTAANKNKEDYVELKLDAEEKVTDVTGKMVKNADGNGEYNGSFNYELVASTYNNYFIFPEWVAALSGKITNESKKFSSSKILTYDTSAKTVSVFGSTKANWANYPFDSETSSYYDIAKAYANKNYYTVDVEQNTAYTFSFDVVANKGKAQFSIVPLDARGNVVKFNPNYSKQYYYHSEYLSSGHYDYQFAVSNPDVKKIQIKFDISGTETNAQFSNIYLYKFNSNLFDYGTFSSWSGNAAVNNNVINVNAAKDATVYSNDNGSRKALIEVEPKNFYNVSYHLENKSGGGLGVVRVTGFKDDKTTVTFTQDYSHLDSGSYTNSFTVDEDTHYIYVAFGAKGTSSAKATCYYTNVAVTLHEDYLQSGVATHVQEYDYFRTGTIPNSFGDNLFSYSDWKNSGSNAALDASKDGIINGTNDGFIKITGETYATQGTYANKSTYVPTDRIYYMPVEAYASYKVSYKVNSAGNTTCTMIYSDSNRDFISESKWTTDVHNGTVTQTVRAPEGAAFVQISFGITSANQKATFTDIQLCKDTKPKAYWYNVKFTPIEDITAAEDGLALYDCNNYKSVGIKGDADFNYVPENTYFTHDSGGYRVIRNWGSVANGTEIFITEGVKTFIGILGSSDVTINLDHQYFTGEINYDGYSLVADNTTVRKGTCVYTKASADEYVPAGIVGSASFSFEQGVAYYTKTLPVSEAKDVDHQYYVISESFRPYDESKGEMPLFSEHLNYYRYVGEGGEYDYTTGTDKLVIFTDTVFHQLAFRNNQWFKRYTLDCDNEHLNDFNVTVVTVTPQQLNNMTAEERSEFLANFELFVFTRGGVSGSGKYGYDLNQASYDALYDFITDASYPIPAVVDIRLNTYNLTDNAGSSVTRIPNLANALTAGISTGGVYTDTFTDDNGTQRARIIYRFLSKDITAGTTSSVANKNYYADIKARADYTQESSTYYDVYDEITYENKLRELRNVYLPLDEKVTEANCIRYILNYRGRRAKNHKETINILEIEPYTNNSNLWWPEASWSQTYVALKSNGSDISNAGSRKTTVTRKDVRQWFNYDGACEDVTYIDAVGDVKKCKFTVTTMIPSEISGKIDDLCQEYDLIYIGCAIDGFAGTHTVGYDKNGKAIAAEKNNWDYGDTIPDYTDDTMDGMYYTNTGDFLETVSSNDNIVYLSGLIKSDYTYWSEAVIDIGALRNTRSCDNYGGQFRTAGNDINNVKLAELKEFVQFGLPVVVDDTLVLNDYVGDLAVSVSGKTYWLRKGYDYSTEDGADAAYENKDGVSNPAIVDQEVYDNVLYVVEPKSYAKKAGLLGDADSVSKYNAYLADTKISSDTKAEMRQLYADAVAEKAEAANADVTSLQNAENSLLLELNSKKAALQAYAESMDNYYWDHVYVARAHLSLLNDYYRLRTGGEADRIAEFEAANGDSLGAAELLGPAYRTLRPEQILDKINEKYANQESIEAEYARRQAEYADLEEEYTALQKEYERAQSERIAAEQSISFYNEDCDKINAQMQKLTYAKDALVLQGDSDYHLLLKARLVGDVPKGAYAEWFWYNDRGEIGSSTKQENTWFFGLFKRNDDSGLKVFAVDTDLDGVDDFYFLDESISTKQDYKTPNVNYWCTAKLKFTPGGVKYNGFKEDDEYVITSNKMYLGTEKRWYLARSNYTATGYQPYWKSSVSTNKTYRYDCYRVTDEDSYTKVTDFPSPQSCNDDIYLEFKWQKDAANLSKSTFWWHSTYSPGDNVSESSWIGAKNNKIRTNYYSTNFDPQYGTGSSSITFHAELNGEKEFDRCAWRMNMNGGKASCTANGTHESIFDGSHNEYATKPVRWFSVSGYRLTLYDAAGTAVDSGYTITGKYPSTSILAGQYVTGNYEHFAIAACVNDKRIDNCSNMFEFLKYSLDNQDITKAKVTNESGKLDYASTGETFINVMTTNQVEREDGQVYRSRLITSVNVSEPVIEIVQAPVSYPDSIGTNPLRFKFKITDGTETNPVSARYRWEFYIDRNGDGQFSDLEKVVGATVSGDKVGQYLRLSSPSTQDYVYTLENVFAFDDFGILPWRLKIYKVGSEFAHYAYSDYAYIEPQQNAEIKAIQVLPSDWRSNYVKKEYFKDRIKDSSYSALGGTLYTGSVFLGDSFNPNAAGSTLQDLGYGKDKSETITRVIYYTCEDYVLPSQEGKITGGNMSFHHCDDSRANGGRKLYGSDGSVSILYSDGTITATKEKVNLELDEWGNALCPCGDHSKISGHSQSASHELTPYMVRFIIGKDFDLSICFTNMNNMNACCLIRDILTQLKNCNGDKAKIDSLISTMIDDDKYDDTLSDFTDIDGYRDYQEIAGQVLKILKKKNVTVDGKSQGYVEAIQNIQLPDDLLAGYNMLVLGFADDWSRQVCLYENTLFGNTAGDAGIPHRGLNESSAHALADYIADNSHAVLFSHDTTNIHVDTVNYIGTNIVAGLTDATNAVGNAWNQFRNWFNSTATDIVEFFGGHLYWQEDFNEDQYQASVEVSLIRNGVMGNYILRDGLGLDRYGITNTFNNWVRYKNGGQLIYNNNSRTYGNRIMNIYSGESYKDDLDIIELAKLAFAEEHVMNSAAKNAATANVNDPHNNGTTYGNVTTKDVMYDKDGKVLNVTLNTAGDKVKAMKDLGYSIAYVPGSDRQETDQFAQGFTNYAIQGRQTTNYKPSYTSTVSQVNKGQITSYPYNINIEDVGKANPNVSDKANYYADMDRDRFTVSNTHEQYYQVNMNENVNGEGATVWFCLSGNDFSTYSSGRDRQYNGVRNDCENQYYVYTKGNCTYTGAGHTNQLSDFEAKLFINTLVASYLSTYDKAAVEFYSDNSGQNECSMILLNSYKENGSGNEKADPGTVRFMILDPSAQSNPDLKFNASFYFTRDTSGKEPKYSDPVTDIVLYRSVSEIDAEGKITDYGVDDYLKACGLTEPVKDANGNMINPVTKEIMVKAVKPVTKNGKTYFEDINPYAIYTFETSPLVIDKLMDKDGEKGLGKVKLWCVIYDEDGNRVCDRAIEIRKLSLSSLK